MHIFQEVKGFLRNLYSTRWRTILLTVSGAWLVAACSASSDAVVQQSAQSSETPAAGTSTSTTSTPTTTASTTSAAASADSATVVFAGGCFWCMEKPFDDLPGVTNTVSGYAGGTVADPNYRQVTAGGTGHYEVVQVTYDPALVSFDDLLQVFWVNVDPLDDGGQFCDRGASYKTAVFYQNADQRAQAEASKTQQAERFKQPIATDVIELAEADFYPAEDYHQNYYLENPVRYNFYRRSCGRDARLAELWGDAASH